MSRRDKWEEVGEVAIDTGTLYLGEPRYFIDRKPKDFGDGTWEDFMERQISREEETHAAEFLLNNGNAGLGVTVRTGWGDGIYPVEVRRHPDGRIAEVRVVFIPEEG